MSEEQVSHKQVLDEQVSDEQIGDRQGQVDQQPRLICVLGDKGGTGKTTFARGFNDLLVTKQVNSAAFDGDRKNAQLHRHYKNTGSGVRRVDVTQRDGGDEIINEMAAFKTPLVLVDLPGGPGNFLTMLEEEIGFLSAVTELGYQMTVVSVLSRTKDAVNQLKETLDLTEGYGVNYVVVKNLFYGAANKFRSFDKSKTKQRLLDKGGVIIEMRELYEDAYDYVDEGDLTFFEATVAKDKSHYANARKVKQWRNHFEQQITLTNGLLGL
ncbi:chromosome partitioning protein ParA [cf. Phormidesmis sp. LEGE 11477]|uniref:chromosome partitioning protein ParA n=1 Tax=cf. Phormidesmis sp. LEGE 11477 TaxID=1828680 RepID=UPI00187E99B3|nr:chromosome partitioning protein ParA [cf. Phormidesmis sp. LEGE 11477]MBE9063455.1 chromosome partitioning protein ParA [cf. Phormidesmis sp. LEGE 11477]